jgi:hypothetical protein
MGVLRSPDGGFLEPSILDATKYLPSLHNVVWERSDRILQVPVEEQVPLEKSQQLAIRRARISVEILKRPSDNQTKFDLFQRLNAGGTQANAQELRNCVMLMVSDQFFRAIKLAAETAPFTTVIDVTEEQIEKQRHMEMAVRFLVHTHVLYDGTLDVEEYIDEGIIHLASTADPRELMRILAETFELLNVADGRNALRRFDGVRHVGKVGLVGLEGVAVAVAKNLAAIQALGDPPSFVRDRSRRFWVQPEVDGFTSSGLRGTTRIQRTVPFGANWFAP